MSCGVLRVVAGSRRWLRLGGARRLFGSGSKDAGDGKRAKRTAKLRIDNLADMNELRRTGGKRWQALDSVTLPEVSPLFPSLSGVTLSGHPTSLPGNLAGSVSLISVYMRDYGKTHCDKYTRTYKDSIGPNPDTSVFELSLIDMWIYRLMSKWMARNLTKTMSPDDQDQFMLYCGKDVSRIKETLELDNSMVGYVFLLDREGRIRWRAHASPTKYEIEALLRCSQQLLEED